MAVNAEHGLFNYILGVNKNNGNALLQ